MPKVVILPSREKREKDKKDGGLQGNRTGTSRKKPDKVDKVKKPNICRCPDCNGKLSAEVGIGERYIEEIQLLKSIVTKYKIPRKYCKKCKKSSKK